MPVKVSYGNEARWSAEEERILYYLFYVFISATDLLFFSES